MRSRLARVSALALVLAGAGVGRAADVDPALQAKIAEKIKAVEAWASDPVLVAACKAQNANPSDEVQAMTQEKWKGLSILDPVIRAFSKNPAGQFLKGKKDDVVSEAFVSAADGRKVAFLAKPSNFSHAGKPKHDKPMKGETWQGDVEVDESSGIQQVQVAVPVKDGDKVVGSLVVGLNVTKLKG
jgi:hypothetical protein